MPGLNSLTPLAFPGLVLVPGGGGGEGQSTLSAGKLALIVVVQILIMCVAVKASSFIKRKKEPPFTVENRNIFRHL
jgi:hypothetical protein